MKILITIAILLLAGLIMWIITYPSPSDPKNLGYILWKAGVCDLTTDTVTAAMVGDHHRNELVIGKTKLQLQSKFGALLPRDKISQYLRNFVETSSWKNQDVLFIGHSPWMVVFDGNKATGLVLVKGY